MCITTVSSIRYMAYDFYFERAMQLFDSILYKTFVENPHLMNALDRSGNHPSI